MKRIFALWLCVAVMGMLAVSGESALAAQTVDEQPYHFGFKKSKGGRAAFYRTGGLYAPD